MQQAGAQPQFKRWMTKTSGGSVSVFCQRQFSVFKWF